jgi:hypothetical protein
MNNNIYLSILYRVGYRFALKNAFFFGLCYALK